LEVNEKISVYTAIGIWILYSSRKTIANEGGNISDYMKFHISPNGVLKVNDLHNAYLKFDVEREFVFTTDTHLAQTITVFLEYKHVAGFFNQIHV
jgi:hypothetical protein